MGLEIGQTIQSEALIIGNAPPVDAVVEISSSAAGDTTIRP